MEKINNLSGKALPLGYANVDTDQIAPSDTLKFSKRENLSDYLFKDWREDSHFILNQPEYKEAIIILAGENFGCGSSREHAPWALLDYGFKAVIAPSFGDIFKNNCSKVGLFTIELEEQIIQSFIDEVKEKPEINLVINLENCTVRSDNRVETFKIDTYTREKFLHELNDISFSLLFKDKIKEYELTRPTYYPSMTK